MVINALNSGAKTFMTDFEDSMSPTWANVINGQINLYALWNDEIDFVDPKLYQEGKKSPALAAILSIVPGLGRIYTGRIYDCFYSMINF